MHLLLVSYYWPPDVNARALRWSAVVRAWLAAGHRITVVTRGGPGQPSDTQTAGLTVIHAGGDAGARLRGALGPASGSGARATLAKIARTVYRATWRQLYWPDFAGPWHRPATRAVRRVLEGAEPVDAMITVSHPFTPHWVGLTVRQAYPNLPWIADCGDPFSLFEEIPLNNRWLYRGRNRRIEGRVLAQADAVAVTVMACRDLYAEAFPESAAKIAVVPPVAAMPAVAGRVAGARSGFAFFGRFYRQLRDPRWMLALLEALAARRPDLSLDIYGDLNDCAARFADLPPALTGRVRLHGMIAPDAAAQAMAESGVLINIGNSTAFQLPSKVFEYAATGRPILNLAQIDADSSAAFLNGYPSALTLRAGSALPKTDVVARLSDWLDRVEPAPQAAVAELLAPHRPAAVAAAYLDLLPVISA